MFSIHRILVAVENPATFTDTSRHMIGQVAWLARHLHAEIILLHAVSAFSHPAGWLESGHEITAKDSHARVVEQLQSDLDLAYLPEFNGIAVTRLLVRGGSAREAIATARDLKVDLVAMSAHGQPWETKKVLRELQCPLWTGAHLEEAGPDEFSIRNVLCSVELNGHSRHTVLLAAGIAAAGGLSCSAGRQIDLLLSDAQMPEMPGPGLGDALKNIRRRIRVMFMSGYTGGDLLGLNYGWARPTGRRGAWV